MDIFSNPNEGALPFFEQNAVAGELDLTTIGLSRERGAMEADPGRALAS